MSEEWSELVWIGISLIITAVIISLAFTFASVGKDMQAGLYEDQATVAKLQEIRAYAPYDDKQVSGSEMISAMVDFSSRGVLVVANFVGSGSIGMGASGSTLEGASDLINELGMTVSTPSSDKYFTSDKVTTLGLLDVANDLAEAAAPRSAPTVAMHKFDSKVYTDSAGNLLAIEFKGVTTDG